MCGATVTAPFDLVKTRLQSSMYHPSEPMKSSIRHLERRTNGKIFHHFVDTGRMIR